MKLKWRCFRGKGGNWIGVCDPVALTIQSPTWANLMEDIGHALNAMLRDLMKSGELQQFLQDRGWRRAGSMPKRPADVWFDIPFIPTMAKMASRDSQVALH